MVNMKSDALNPFIDFTLSKDAIKLANMIYNTYKQENDPYLVVSVQRLCAVFGFRHYTCSKKEKQILRDLFDELNEPIRVIDFKYKNRTYEWKSLQFCTFEKSWEDEDTSIELMLNEMYIAAMKEYLEEDSFIPTF